MSASSMNSHELDIECRLDVNYPRPGDVYQLRIFTTSPDAHPNSHELLIDDLRPNQSHRVQMRVRRNPGLVHAWLFATNRHPLLRIKRTVLIGWGCLEIASLENSHTTGTPARIMFTDVTKGKQGHLDVTLVQAVKPPFSRTELIGSEASTRSALSLLFHRVHSAITQVYDELRGPEHNLRAPEPDRSNFYYVQTHMGRMPITTFAYLSTLIERTNATVDLLKVLLLRAEDEIRTIRTHGSVINDKAEQLVAMATLLPRALHYTDDVCRKADGVDEMVDQWAQLGTYPCLATTGFDCEDGAGVVLAVLHLIRTCHIDGADAVSERLREMQAFAKQFTPAIVLGNMKVSPTEYVVHAYVVAVDAKWLESKLVKNNTNEGRSTFLPTMTFESTANISGAWDKEMTPAAAAISHAPLLSEFRSARSAVAKTFQSHADLHQTMRQFTPMQLLNTIVAVSGRHRGSYEDAYVLMAPDHMGSRVVHCIVSNSKRRSIGALMEEIAWHDPAVQLHAVFDQPREEFEATYQCMWMQQPRNRLPQANLRAMQQMQEKETKTMVRSIGRPICGIFDFPLAIFNENERIIRSNLDALASPYKYTIEVDEPLTSCGIGFVRVYLVKD